jgi:hypothetical protein
LLTNPQLPPNIVVSASSWPQVRILRVAREVKVARGVHGDRLADGIGLATDSADGAERPVIADHGRVNQRRECRIEDADERIVLQRTVDR